jgi:signal transduction histidine kinase
MLTVDTASDSEVAVLHAETDEQARRAVEQSLRLELDGVRTLSVDRTDEAVERVERRDVGCVLSEYRNDSLDGLALHRAVRNRDSEVPSVFFSDVEVADTGRGIPDERKEAAFSRGESARGRTKRGDLGLYTVETVVSAYGGAVWIDDNEPRGTIVCLDLLGDDLSEE